MNHTGSLIAVVGASGVGKDSVIEGLLAESPCLTRAKRVITRAPELAGEDFYPLNNPDFDRAVANREFCLHWRAHGLCYGIPQHVLTRVQQGDCVIANLSRSVLLEAEDKFPKLVVLHLTARAETLAKRLRARGREAENDVKTRLARSTFPMPDGLHCIEISNDGDLHETVQTIIQRFDVSGILPESVREQV